MHLKAHRCLQARPVPGTLLSCSSQLLPCPRLCVLHEDLYKRAKAPSSAPGPKQRMSSHSRRAAPPPSSLLLPLPPRTTAIFCSSQARHPCVPFSTSLPNRRRAQVPRCCQAGQRVPCDACRNALFSWAQPEPQSWQHLSGSPSGARGSHTCRSRCSGMSTPAPCLSPSSHTCPSRRCSTELF